MRRRVLAFLMTLVLLVSMVPTAAFAEGNVGAGTAESPYQIGDTVTNDGSAQPSGATVENSYWVRKDVYDTSAPICTKEVHDHTTTPCQQVPAAVECALAGHPTEGELTTYTHEDGKVCTYDPQQAKWFAIGTVWSCGKEAHAHSEANGCYKLVHTVWTLTAVAAPSSDTNGDTSGDTTGDTTGETGGKTCEEGCILTGEAHEECLVWVACTLTAGCEGPSGHEGECYGASLYAEYTVTLQARRDGDRLRMVEIMITDAEGNTVGYVTTNDRGNATIDLPDGTYTATISYTSGNYVYGGEETFIVNGEDQTVTVNVEREVSASYGESIYNNTSYFNHVDIRVKGTYTTGTSDDLTTYNIKLQNVSIVIDNPTEDGYQDYTQSFSDNSETYEWRKTGIRVHKGATVSLVCDIIDSTTGETLKNGFTYSFFGKAHFVQAIINCDAHQGLDFIIDPLEILEAITHEVSYQWRIVDADGNYVTDSEGNYVTPPANVANLPATTSGYETGDSHTIDTIYHEGTYVIVESADGTSATAYQFYGWDWWTHDAENLTQNTIGSSETALSITSDTIIFGVWRTFELEKATSHLTITKAFSGNEDNLPAGYTIVVTGPLGGDYDIPLSMFTWDEGKGKYVYNMPVYSEGIFTIREEAYAIDGYTLEKAAVTVTDAPEEGHNHLTEVAGSNTGTSVQVEVELHWQEAGTESVSTAEDTQHDYLGAVDFTNTYVKETGEDIYDLPNLRIDKMDAANRNVLAGATFELRDATTGAVVVNGDGIELVGVSDEFGYIYFYNIPVDTTATQTVYNLVETDAPDGYAEGYAEYQVVITEKDGSPTQILQDGVWHDYHSYDMKVMVSLDGGVNWFESQHFSVGATGNRFRLGAFNFKIDGQLTISKTFSGLAEDVYPDAIIVRVQGKDSGYDESVTINKSGTAGSYVYTTTLTGLEMDTYYVNETHIVIGSETIALDGGEYAIPGYFFDGVTYTVTDGTAAPDAPRNNGVVLSESDLVEGEGYVASVSMGLTNNYVRLEDDAYVWPVLEILKLRDSNNQPIEGVEFTLYQGTTVFATATTGINGKAIFNFTDYATEELEKAISEAGKLTLSLEETRAADGYAENTTTYRVTLELTKQNEELEDGVYVTTNAIHVSVSDGTNTTTSNTTTTHFTVKNTKDEGSLTIAKTFGADNAYIPAAIEVTISGPNNYSNVVTLAGSAGWMQTLSGLELGEYTVTEVSMTLHDGTKVALNATQDATLSFKVNGTTYYFNPSLSTTTYKVDLTSANENQTASLQNTFSREVVNPASFQVKKVDETGKVLRNGATFALYNTSGDVVMTQSTGADGIATFTGFIEAGTYYLKETAAPAGYYLDNTVWEVQVTLENGKPTITVNKDSGIWETIFNWIANLLHKDNGYWDGSILTVMNTVNPGLNIVKQDIGTEEPIVGAGFTLYAEQSCTTAIGTELFTDENGKLNLPITTAGTYYLKETTTPTGYLDSDPVYIVVAETESKTVTLNGVPYSVDELVITIDGQDTKTIDGVIHYVVENEALVEIKVTKVWDDEGYHDRPTEVTAVLKRDGEEVDSVTLNRSNNWTYTWEEVEIDGITVPLTNAYTWTVEEEDDFSDLGYNAPVIAGEDNDFNIVNTREPNLIDVTVTKEWVLNGADNPPASVKVTLMRNGEEYQEVTLNKANKWTYTWKDLSDVYVWTVVEGDVAGYELEEIKQDIANNGDMEFTITNSRIINPVEVTVTKNWVNGEKDKKITFPTSVKVALYKDGKKVETVTLNAANDWTYTWDDLTDEHEWKVDEPNVPSGYIKTIKTTSTETTDGYEYKYAITNTYNSNPKTGDFSGIGFWGTGMIVPVLALFVLLLGGNKKKGKYQA